MSSKVRFLKRDQRTSDTAHEVLSKWLAAWPWRRANLLQVVAAPFTSCVTPGRQAGSLCLGSFTHEVESGLFHCLW